MISESRQILFWVVLTVLRLVSLSRAINRSNFCPSPQNGIIGAEGFIRCHVTQGFVGVYWFDESNERNPLIRCEDDIISGHHADQYDILMDGSLVIKRVSKEHGRHYKLVVIDKDYSDFEEDIRFDVIAVNRSNFCPSPQNGTIGEEGIIRCHISQGFVRVYWFDESSDRNPLIRYEDNIISGRNTDQYEILMDGSLVIKTVSKEHGKHYKLVVTDKHFSEFEEDIRFDVIDTSPETYSKYQNGELGSKAIIKWNIGDGFEGVYWFDNINDRDPIVRYEAGVKSGRLYQVEYDICDNGSLVIKNVTAKYDNSVFKLIVIDANYDVQEEEIHFSVIDLHATEQITTTPYSMTAYMKSPFSTQSSQSLQTTIRNTQPPKSSQTSMSSLSFQASSTSSPDGDRTESFTRSESVKYSPIQTSPQHESVMPSIDVDDKNGCRRLSSCLCLQYLLLLPFILFHY